MTRTDVLNHLAEKYKLKRFLEIGVQNPAQNFDKIKCEYKVSVDPDPNAHASFCMTSDKFFSLTDDDLHDYGWASLFKVHGKKDHYWSQFDLVFIDGMHTAEQVEKDFDNAIKVLSRDGWVCVHDCSPEREEFTHVPRDKTGSWNGDVFKWAMSTWHNKMTVDVDNGVLIFCNNWPDINIQELKPEFRTWEYFDAHRKELLNLITYEEFISL